MADFILSYTGEEVNERLGQIDEKANISDLAVHINNKNNPHEVEWEQLLNKPFGEEDFGEEFVYEATMAYTVDGLQDSEYCILEEGAAYKVIYNGVEYELIASVVTSVEDGVEYTGYLLGNASFLGMPDGEDTGEPFLYISITNNNGYGFSGIADPNINYNNPGSVTISIYKKNKKIKTIDPKYLPTNTTITIKRWEAND